MSNISYSQTVFENISCDLDYSKNYFNSLFFSYSVTANTIECYSPFQREALECLVEMKIDSASRSAGHFTYKEDPAVSKIYPVKSFLR